MKLANRITATLYVPLKRGLGDLWKNGFRGNSGLPSPHDFIMTLLGAVMAIVVFCIDTFTPIESAIAVLYVLSLMMFSSSLRRVGILRASVICFVLCVLSFIIQHGSGSDLSTVLRLLVSLSAISITAALLLSNDTSRQRLIESQAESARGEYRYRSIFEGARVAIYEQDFSRLHAYLENLKRDGVTDIRRYALHDDAFVKTCASMVETVAANDAALELLEASEQQELLGPLDKFIPDGDHRFFDVVHTLYEGRSEFKSQGTIKTMDGTTKSVLTVLKFPDDVSALQRVVVALVDITEREQTHNALLAAQMELARATRVSTVGVVSASIAHELRQPIGALTVNAETCLRWLDNIPPNLDAARNAVKRMVSDAERASHILKTTRAFMSNRSEPNGSVDAVSVIRETAEFLQHELRRDSVSLSVSSTRTAVHVVMTRNELQQVIINLITNAAQALSETSSMTRRIEILITRDEDAKARIEVSDNGPGIDEGKLDRLFDPFFTTKSNGMGMGLTISHSTVEARGGRLRAYNNVASPGARFVIELPLLDVKAVAPVTSVEEAQ